VNCQDADGRTCGHWAAYHGRVALLKMFLETTDMQYSLMDKEGRSPLHWVGACQRNGLVVEPHTSHGILIEW